MGWGVDVKWQAEGGPCYTFLKLNRKTYHMEFGFKMLIYANDIILRGGAIMWMFFGINGIDKRGSG